tara:strand:+ start:13090 stop:14817 length:1728 start_codon:yes stop_codon:yes gene_type:complete
MESADEHCAPKSKILILIALVQGLMLLLLHDSIELQFWPYQQPQWLFALYSVAIAAPLMLLLGLTDNWRVMGRWVAAYAVVLFGLGYYVGGQAMPIEHIGLEALLFPLVATLCVATFKALMYTQHFSGNKPLSYSRLFLLSWRNFLTLGLSLLFMLCAWGVLMLWAGLFKAIKVHFFYDLFTQRWFYYPVLALAHGFGVIIFRAQSGVIDTITRIQQALMKFLLVMLAFVSVMFLFALPFTGLDPLWETGGSNLILWMQALILFFINAVHQDEPDAQPYQRWVHRFVYSAVALLPIYSLISFYGLSLRIDQYGWSVARCWAFLLWSVFAGFSFSYLWGIVRLKDRWLEQLSSVNIRMGVVVLCLMLLVNSPVLDFRKITVNSQLSRLDNAETSLNDFDYRYFRRQLAGPGYLALQELKREVRDDHPEIALRIESFYVDIHDLDSAIDRADFVASIVGVDSNTPQALVDTLYEDLSNNHWRMQENQTYRLVAVDLNTDGFTEYVLVEVRSSHINFTLYHQVSGNWENRSLNPVGQQKFNSRQQRDALLKALERTNYEAIDSPWKNLKVGGQTFQVN